MQGAALRLRLLGESSGDDDASRRKRQEPFAGQGLRGLGAAGAKLALGGEERGFPGVVRGEGRAGSKAPNLLRPNRGSAR